jgi:hypothetical protein
LIDGDLGDVDSLVFGSSKSLPTVFARSEAKMGILSLSHSRSVGKISAIGPKPDAFLHSSGDATGA